MNINKLKTSIIVAVVIIFGALLVFGDTSAFADVKSQISSGVSGANTGVDANTDIYKTVENIIGVVLIIVGILSVGMIIYGGVKYTMSAGDSSKMTSAKNTITYAIVGLVVSMAAYAIVKFVTDNI